MTFLRMDNSTLLHVEVQQTAMVRAQLEEVLHHGARTYQLQAERIFPPVPTKRMRRSLQVFACKAHQHCLCRCSELCMEQSLMRSFTRAFYMLQSFLCTACRIVRFS